MKFVWILSLLPLISMFSGACIPSTVDDLPLQSGTTGPVRPIAASSPDVQMPPEHLSVAAGWMHTCFYRQGIMRCVGYNNHGQLGYGDTASRGLHKQEQVGWLPNVPTPGDQAIWAVAAGALSTCVVDQQHNLFCWGYPMGSLQAQGSSTAKTAFSPIQVQLRPHTGIAQLSASKERWGEGHTCVVFRDGGLHCFGNNDDGQIGLGDRSIRFSGVGGKAPSPDVDLGESSFVVQVALGARHTCALLATGQVKCFGDNTFGALGLQDTLSRGAEPEQMGDKLPYVDLGFQRKAIAITAGDTHTCALLDNKTVKCWGGNTFGQLGLADKQSRGDKPNTMGDQLPPVYFGKSVEVTAIDAGLLHTCVITNDQQVKCFGDNFGSLGLEHSSLAGSNLTYTTAGIPSVPLGALQIPIGISCGGHHSCVIMQNNTAKCFGHNWHGQLGLGDQLPRGSRVKTMGDNLPSIYFPIDSKNL